MGKGKIIVVEGACDGIGKSTQFNLLKNRLEANNYEISHHHFPTYGSVQGALVENYLKGNFGKIKNLSPYFVNSLYAIDRAVTWQTNLRGQYEAGKLMLFDRYTTSSIIYQASVIDDIEERKRFIDYMVDFEYHKMAQQVEPDIVVFLTADFDVVTKMRLQRKNNDGIENDIHERDLEFMKRVYDNANFVADYLNWEIIECSKESALLSKEEIHESVYSRVRKIL